MSDLAFSPEYGPPVSAEYWRLWRERLRRTRPLVVLHGGYGKRNLGDDAILYVLLSQLREALPESRIVVLCHGPALVRRDYGVEAHYFASRAAWHAILNADLYIIGGGGIVNRINVYSGWRRARVLDPKGKFLFLAALLAGSRGAKVLFHAIGATSVPDPLVGWLARIAIGRADEVSVRDPLSRQVLQRLGVRREMQIVPDPAVLLPAAPAPIAKRILSQEGLDPEARLVGINMRPVIEPDVDNLATAAAIAEVADWLVERHSSQICFLPFGRHPRKWAENDEWIGRAIGERMRHRDRFRILRHECTPPEMKAIVGEMDCCLMERLHAAILAATAGVPFLVISYDAKVEQFAQAIGAAERVIALRDLTASAARNKLDEMLPWR